MAFKVRCEFWELSNDGIGTTILDEAIADAVEYTTTQDDVELPATNGAYAMSVYGLTGAATVEVSTAAEGTPERGRLVTVGTTHWFVVRSGDKLTVQEYTLP